MTERAATPATARRGAVPGGDATDVALAGAGRDLNANGLVSDAEQGGAPGADAPAAPTLDRDVHDSTWRPEPPPTAWQKSAGAARWLPALLWQRVARKSRQTRPAHLIIAVADHFEPNYEPNLLGVEQSDAEQEARVEHWCRGYRRVADAWRDADDRPLVHTFFYPAEEYSPAVAERLAEFSREGFGEVEVHLHHGVWEPDTAANTRVVLERFTANLVRHGCLSRWNGTGPARYAFVHGNWALANSLGGRFCGVDDEMQILADTGCYADFTLPSAPSDAQVAKINSMYECGHPLTAPAPHRRGRDLRVGRAPQTWPLIMQGPLGVYRANGTPGGVLRLRLENGELATSHAPTLTRIDRWRRSAITVEGRPDWVFIKLHCHGLDPSNVDAMTGGARTELLRNLREYADRGGHTLHFVTAREMVNVALAACDGREGDPNAYRDYRLRLIRDDW